MKFSKSLTAGAAAIALMGTSACVTNPETGNQRVSTTGAIGGA